MSKYRFDDSWLKSLKPETNCISIDKSEKSSLSKSYSHKLSEAEIGIHNYQNVISDVSCFNLI